MNDMYEGSLKSFGPRSVKSDILSQTNSNSQAINLFKVLLSLFKTPHILLSNLTKTYQLHTGYLSNSIFFHQQNYCENQQLSTYIEQINNK